MGKPLRVLIVEDSAADAELVLRELRRGGYEPAYERVDTAEALSKTLEKQVWDLILADYMMPSFTGLAALEIVKAKGLDLPFIIVSGQIGEDIAVSTMKAGAHDYVMKGSLTRLAPAVERELHEAANRRERRKAEEERTRLMEELRAVNEQVVVSSLRLQEQAEQANRQAAELDAIFVAIPVGLLICNPAGEVIRLNSVAADLLGYSEAECKQPVVERAALLQMETAEGRPFTPEEVPAQRALRGEVVRGVVMVFHRPSDQSAMRATVSAAPIRTADGKLAGAVAVLADITALQNR